MSTPVRLTDLDIRILDLLAAGHLQREIAQIEGLPIGSVHNRLHHLRVKLNVGSAHGALLEWMAKNGWDVSALRFENRRGLSVARLV